MKRSKALEYLINLIRSTEYIDIPNENYYKPKELSEEILDLIENDLEMKYVGRNSIGWEPEDDKKS